MKFYKNKYYQGSLSDRQAEILLQLVNDYSEIQDLKHIITDLSVSDRRAVIESGVGGNTDTVGTLTSAQTIGVAYLYYAGRALLGDEVGLGKTVITAGLMNLLYRENPDFKCCFLTEKTAVSQIRDKLVRFTGRYVDLLESAEAKVLKEFYERNKGGIENSFVGSHSLLGNSEFVYYLGKHPVDLLVVDESAILRKTTHTYYKAVKTLLNYIDRAVILNATPLETSAKDIYNQLKLLDKSFMPTVAEFESAFCRKAKKVFGMGYDIVGYKNCEVFKEAISLRYLARTRDDIGATTENNNVNICLVPMSPIQKKLSKKTSLHQMVADYPTGVDFTIEYSRETTGKLEALISLFESMSLVQEKVLIYCRFVECQVKMAEELENIGCKCAILNGSLSVKKRAQLINDFNMGVYTVLITSIDKSIDLEGCDNCIMYTLDPNPQKMVQVFGRLTRSTDVENKNLYFLISEGKEKTNFETKSKLRASASMQFTRVGTNLVLEAIANSEL